MNTKSRPAPRQRLRWREQGRERRAYADFRDFKDVGGGYEALRPPGSHRATTDPDLAQQLLANRLKDLDARRRGIVTGGPVGGPGLAAFADIHLTAKAKSGKFTAEWLGEAERHLTRAARFFGGERQLGTITVKDLRRWTERLLTEYSPGTVRHHLNSLSNLYRRAQGEGLVLPGYNPAAAMMERPNAARREASWLEASDAALLLEAARTTKLQRADLAVPYLHELLSTFLLTGGRRREVLGLEVKDIDFERKTVTFRPNDWRRLKTATSHRVIPLWPQLADILRPYLNAREADVIQGQPVRRLLFPRTIDCHEQMLGDFRKGLAQLTQCLGWKDGEVTPKSFRHTYCSARLQTLDRGYPVGIFTVGRELGHGGESLVKRIYGHLGEHRHRSEVVEYRVDAFPHLAEQVSALRQPRVTVSATVVDSASRKSLLRP